MQKTFALFLLLIASLFGISQNNIGINTATPHAPLQFDNSLVNRKLVLYEGANNDHQYNGFGVNAGLLRYQIPNATDAHVFYAGASPFLSNELFRITGTGRVGVRVSNPLIGFDMLGDTIGIRNSTSSWENLWFHVNGSSANISASGAENGLRFRVGSNNTGAYGNGQSFDTVMTLLPNGRVGIGVPNPFSQLSNTDKNMIASDGSGGNPGSFTWSANQPGYAAMIYNEGDIYTSGGLSVKVLENTAKILDLSRGQRDRFGYPVMNVWADGRIGIGTHNPVTPVEIVAGTSRTGLRIAGGKGQTDCDGLLILRDSSSNTASNGSNELIEFVNAVGQIIGSVTRVANANSVAFNITSDTRLKTGIHPTRYGLNDLMAIEVADYQYKGTPNAASQTGFLAQQLYKIFPEAVAKGSDADEKQPYMVDYSKLTPLLVKAVQELKAQVDALQKENEALKATANAGLEDRLKKLEALVDKQLVW